MSKVIVAGSLNMDIVALASHHPKIGETILGTDLRYFPGGKGANQAVAAAKLGAKTVMIGKVGSDAFGGQLTEFIKQHGIEVKISATPEAPTGTAIITVAKGTSDNTIVVIPGANSLLAEKDIAGMDLGKGDVLISQLEIPLNTIIAFFRKGRQAGTLNIFNPAPAQVISKDLLQLVDILILNETELGAISGLPVDISDERSISLAAQKVKIDNLSVVVTLGVRGAIAFSNEGINKISGKKVNAVDTTGAGDCFIGAMAASLAEGKSFVESLATANVAASISVTRAGAGPSMPSREEMSVVI